MYECSDILTNDTVFDDDEDACDADDFNENQSYSNQFQNSGHQLSPTHHYLPESSSISSSIKSSMKNTDHFPVQNINVNFHGKGRPSLSNGLGFVYSQNGSSFQHEVNDLHIPIEDSPTISNGIPIASRPPVRIAPNASATGIKSPISSAPSPYSPPIFFSLPSPPQFTQMQHPIYPHQYNLIREPHSSQHMMGFPTTNNIHKQTQDGHNNEANFPSNYQYHRHEEDIVYSPLLDNNRDAYLEENDVNHMHPYLQARFNESSSQYHSHYQYDTPPGRMQSSQSSYQYPRSYDDYTNASLLTSRYQNNRSLPSIDNIDLSSSNITSGITLSPSSPSSISLSKKERNRLAAERCRKKKQDLISTLSRENKLLHQGNVELTRSNHYLEQKLEYLINILISMDPSKVVLLKDLHRKAPSSGYYMDLNANNVPLATTSNSPGMRYNSAGLYNAEHENVLDVSAYNGIVPSQISPLMSSHSLISTSGVYQTGSNSVSSLDHKIDNSLEMNPSNILISSSSSLPK